MFLSLHNLTIQLQSEDTAIQEGWQALFNAWPLAETAPAAADLGLWLSLVDALPPLPDTPPFFSDSQHGRILPDTVEILSVYQGDGEWVRLHYLDGALVDVPLYKTSSPTMPGARGCLVARAMAYGRFEDITFTSLAPLLRRQGYFLVHAFAAAKDGRAVLIVGPSGSGKTTTGLSLLLAGWRLLANDVLLLQERADGIYALPTPGAIGIRPQTLNLLPELRDWVGELSSPGQTDITQSLLNVIKWSEPARVTAVAFPHVEQRQESRLAPKNRAICLAQLMAESIDQWDTAMLLPHMTLLQQLSQQAAAFNLLLGQDMAQLAGIMAELP